MVDRESPEVDLFGRNRMDTPGRRAILDRAKDRARLPKKLYRLVIEKGTGQPMGYGERGGGTFHSLPDMQTRLNDMKRKGRTVRVFECEPEWKEIDVP